MADRSDGDRLFDEFPLSMPAQCTALRQRLELLRSSATTGNRL